MAHVPIAQPTHVRAVGKGNVGEARERVFGAHVVHHDRCFRCVAIVPKLDFCDESVEGVRVVAGVDGNVLEGRDLIVMSGPSSGDRLDGLDAVERARSVHEIAEAGSKVRAVQDVAEVVQGNRVVAAHLQRLEVHRHLGVVEQDVVEGFVPRRIRGVGHRAGLVRVETRVQAAAGAVHAELRRDRGLVNERREVGRRGRDEEVVGVGGVRLLDERAERDVEGGEGGDERRARGGDVADAADEQRETPTIGRGARELEALVRGEEVLHDPRGAGAVDVVLDAAVERGHVVAGLEAGEDGRLLHSVGAAAESAAGMEEEKLARRGAHVAADVVGERNVVRSRSRRRVEAGVDVVVDEESIERSRAVLRAGPVDFGLDVGDGLGAAVGFDADEDLGVLLGLDVCEQRLERRVDAGRNAAFRADADNEEDAARREVTRRLIGDGGVPFIGVALRVNERNKTEWSECFVRLRFGCRCGEEEK